MKPALKSEFIKLFSVRSTFFWSLVPLCLVFFGSFYIQGFRGTDTDYNSAYFVNSVIQSAAITSFFIAIISILHMAHEYRYNTITYTLTLINSRSKVLLAKIIAILGFAVIFSAVIMALSIGFAALGAHLAGHALPAQDFNTLEYFSRAIFYCSGFAMAGLLITVLVRHLAASIVILFIVPSIVENLFSLVLKDNAKYLPFRSLQQVIDGVPGGLTPLRASGVFLIYLLVGWSIAWWLFLRRDAN